MKDHSKNKRDICRCARMQTNDQKNPDIRGSQIFRRPSAAELFFASGSTAMVWVPIFSHSHVPHATLGGGTERPHPSLLRKSKAERSTYIMVVSVFNLR